MTNFWQKLNRPFLVLAPMQDVTDYVFREIVAEIGRPDVFFTEFTSAEGLNSNGYEKVVKSLKYSEKQRPIVAQIWGIEPESFYKTAQIIESMGFDGIDINMGCPDKNVVSRKSGAALIRTPEVAKELIQAVKEGAGKTPISVKTRIGFKSVVTEEWITYLLQQNIDALTIHGRTAKQLSKVDANWEEISKAVQIKNQLKSNTIIIGNGDIKSYKQAIQAQEKYGVDGVMIGRGIFSDPWIFNKDQKEHTTKEHLELLLKHAKLFHTTWGKEKNFEIMKKFFKMYIVHFKGSARIRNELMACKSYDQVEKIVSDILNS